MMSVRSMLVLWLLTTVVSLSISPVLNAQNRPPRGSATQQKTEENVERGTNTGVRVEDMKVLIDNAIANKQIVSGLKAKILRKQILFDVTLAPNEAEEPWMILLNLTDEKFAEANQEYTAQGTELWSMTPLSQTERLCIQSYGSAMRLLRKPLL